MTKKNTPASTPLAIVGIGCLFPKAGDVEEYWSNIREGVDAITEVPESHWKPEEYFDTDQKTPDMTYARRGGFLEPVDFNPLLYGMSPNNIEATDTTQLLGMEVARKALLDAGYSTGHKAGDGRDFDRDRTSVIMGVTGTLELVIPLGARLGHPIWRQALKDAGVDTDTAEDVVQRISDGYVPWQENSFPGLLGNVAAGRIANRFDLGGTNCVVDAACASSLSAIHMAMMELQAGRSDMAIAGGLDTFNDIFMYMCFSKTPALSPTGNSRPFAKGADGTILGEGLGAVVLKRLDDARSDGDDIYAVIKGIGSSSDGRGNAIYAPSVAGQTKALLDAYDQAGVSPSSIEMVEAHGTGTAVGDAVEVEALEGVFRQDKAEGSWCAIGSVKSMIGHTKSAAGAAGLIKTALALKHRVLPPTLKVDQPLPQLEPGKAPLYINTVKRPWVASKDHPRRAALSALGFGGSNFHCVVEEANPEADSIDWDGRTLLFAFSADSVDGLLSALTVLDDDPEWKVLRKSAAQSRVDFDAKQKYRLSLVIEKDKINILTLIKTIRGLLTDKSSQSFWQLPIGAVFSSGDITGNTGVLFPGQGSQYVGMLRDLTCHFPQLRKVLEQANIADSDKEHGDRLSDIVFPIPVFDDESRQAQEARLRDTRNAQPAIGAVSLGGMKILEHFGLKVDITAGHSYGELVALCAAQCYDEKALHALSRLRGELMFAGEGDRGSMLAVSATVEQLSSLIDETSLNVVIANHNAPKQVVLSGATDAIEQMQTLCAEKAWSATRLPVSAAFHSTFVADAEQAFGSALKDVDLQASVIPVLANTTADSYPEKSADILNLLAGQLARPVKFVSEIEKMYELGVRTFVEVGPGSRLSGLVKAILENKDEIQVLSLDASAGKRHGLADLANVLAALAVLGKNVDLTLWDEDYLENLIEEAPAKMTIKLSGKNYVLPRDKRPPTPPKQKQPVMPQVSPQAASAPVVTSVSSGAVSNEALQATQQSILALQQMQEQTADLHRQYLQGQETAQQTIQQLLNQQQRLMGMPVVDTAVAPVAVSQPHPEVSTSVVPVVEIIEPVEQPQVPAVEPVSHQDNINNVLLEVVSEKTGYPLEMLSLDMSLDTDLGIDSIKRVEILSALQERLPWAPTVNPEELGTFHFLQHIVEYLLSGSEGLDATSVSTEQSVNTEGLQDVLLNIVADKTGYPIEMLNLEMSLDADLGIDSIKRVEILSALQEQLPEMPSVSPESMGQLLTLEQIVGLLNESSVADPVTVETVDAITDNKLSDVLLEVVSDKTGYPLEMLNLDMSLDTDLGIDSIKRVEILSALQDRRPDMPAVKPEELGALHTLQQIVDHMGQQSSSTETQNIVTYEDMNEVVENSQGCLTRRVLTTVLLDDQEGRDSVSLTADAMICVATDASASKAELKQTQHLCDVLKSKNFNAEMVSMLAKPEANTQGLIIVAPQQPGPDYLHNAFTLIQRFSPALRASGKQQAAILTGVTQFGGDFGLTEMTSADPVTGGLAGLIKTADKEWPEVSCKAIDIEDVVAVTKFANEIIDECLLEGPLEVGLSNDGNVALQTENLALKAGEKGQPPINAGDVVVITGGARGVTAEIAHALAESYKAKLLLLGRSPLPEAEADWLGACVTDAEIKKALLAKADSPLKPAELEQACQRVLANREVQTNITRMEASGVQVEYQSVDVRDADAVEKAINTARQSMGPIRGIVHGAGVLADRLIEDKTVNQFDLVFGTKVDGANALLAATRDDDLGFIVMFSSSTGRFGRTGQCDYAAANEVLNKLAQQQSRIRCDCRVVSINWGPWDGGMVTPSLKKIFAQEGVGVIGLQAGADYLIQEIATPGPVEIVILGSVSGNPKGGQDVISEATASEIRSPIKPEKPISKTLHLAFKRQLNVDNFPFLKDHVMNGRAVLPVAIIIEWFAHGALHGNPGMNYLGFDDFRILKGLTMEQHETIELGVYAGTCIIKNGKESVQVELRSGETLHARANIVLSHEDLPTDQPGLPAVNGAPIATGFYENGYLFHGESLQGIQQVEACSEQGIIALVSSASSPADWIRKPVRSSWVSDPLVLDTSFQMMILWSFKQLGVGSLPTAISQYRQYNKVFPKVGVRVVIQINEFTEHKAKSSIEFIDDNNQLIARIDGYESISDASLKAAFERNVLAAA